MFDGYNARRLRPGALDFDSAVIEIEVANLEAEWFANPKTGKYDRAITGL